MTTFLFTDATNSLFFQQSDLPIGKVKFSSSVLFVFVQVSTTKIGNFARSKLVCREEITKIPICYILLSVITCQAIKCPLYEYHFISSCQVLAIFVELAHRTVTLRFLFPFCNTSFIFHC